MNRQDLRMFLAEHGVNFMNEADRTYVSDLYSFDILPGTLVDADGIGWLDVTNWTEEQIKVWVRKNGTRG